MKSMKALFVIAALTVSSLAMATGGGDRTTARMENARKVSMEAHKVSQQQAEAAVAESKAKAASHSNS